MNKYRKLLSNTALFAIGNFAIKILLFLLMPLYTSTLTPEQYGISDLLNTSVELLIPVFTLCITDAVFRFSIDDSTDRRKMLLNAVTVMVAGFLLLVIIAPLLVGVFQQEYILYFLLLYFTNAANSMFAQFARGIGHIKVFVISGVIGALVLLSTNIVFLLILKMGIFGYILATVISNIISCSYIIMSSKLYKYITFSKIDVNLLKSMLTYSIFLVPNNLSWWITNISNRYILAVFCGAGIVGLFAAAGKLAAIINLLSAIFQQAWQLSSVQEYSNEGYQKFYSNVFKYYFMLISIGGAAILTIIPYISYFILKNDFYDGWIYAPLLVFAAILGCLSYFFGTIYMVAKKSKMAMVSTLCGAIVNVFLSLLLVPYIGPIGAAVATVVAYMVIALVRIIDSRKIFIISADWGKVVLCIVTLLLQTVILTINTSNTLILCVALFIFVVLINLKDLFEFSNRLFKGSLHNS